MNGIFNQRALVIFGILLASASAAELQSKRTERLLKHTPLYRSYIKTPEGERRNRQLFDVVTSTTPDGKDVHSVSGNIECRLWNACTVFQEGVESTHEWSCTFEDHKIRKRFGGYDDKVVIAEGLDINEYLDLWGAVSGKTVLVLTGMDVFEDRIVFESDQLLGLEEYDPDLRGGAQGSLRSPKKPFRRGLAEPIGTLNTLVVRVVATDNAPPPAADLSEDIFKDEWCLKSQYRRCSYEQMIIEEYDGSTVPMAADGVVDVEINISSGGKDKSEIQNAANIAASNMFDVDRLDEKFDLVLFCMPPGMGNWLAYAYVGRFDSYYNDDWCQSMSAQMHEVGHNIGLDHSGEYEGSDGNQEYGDKMGMMGFSYKSDDTPKQCFNPAKNFQLGWYTDKAIEIDPSNELSTNPTEFVLNGIVDYEDNSTPNATVVLKVGKFYIGYNRKTGFNEGTQEAGNQVTIQQKLGDDLVTSAAKSKLEAALSLGGLTQIEINELLTIQINFVRKSADGKDAFIEIKVAGGDVECVGGYNAEIEIELITDNYPEETSWGIVDYKGQYVYNKGDYTASGTYTETVGNLCKGLDYYFVIEDTYGDGICCDYGAGSFQGTFNGLVLFDGGTFENEMIKPFQIPLDPTEAPVESPTGAPTANPTAAPTGSPTSAPTGSPTSAPTGSPTSAPTGSPTSAPTDSPTSMPTSSPTSAPTVSPTSAPTASPTGGPTGGPTTSPTASPTAGPTGSPTTSPTASPTAGPTGSPTTNPTASPTSPPTSEPTSSPTTSPVALAPTDAPDNSGCVDDSNFLYRGKSGKDCSWVAAGTDRQTRIKCLRRANAPKSDERKVREYCRASCDAAGINQACE